MKPTNVLAFVLLCLFISKSTSRSNLRILDENNWQTMLEGEWMVEFYAPWCPACRALEPVWKEFASWSDDLNIHVGQVDVTESPGLSGRFMVTALPTIFHVKDGVFRQYRGTRDKDEFISFVEEKKWEIVEPIPSWKAPSSIQMSVVSEFFKLSMLLRNIHTKITEEHGIPYWGSYLLFAIATIVIGAVLGLVLVFIIDCFYPSKVQKRNNEKNSQQDANRTSEASQEEDEEEIIDEDGSGSDALEESSEEKPDTEKAIDGETKEEESENVAAGSSSPDVRRRRSRKAD